MDYVHATRPGGLLTYCGLFVRKSTSSVRLQFSTPYRRMVDCPQCLDHQEVKARIVEQTLIR